MIKFFGVGLINTAVGYMMYAMLILLHISYLTALLIATVAGVIFNYFSIGRLVFNSRGGLIIFSKFITTYGAVYLVNALSLEGLIQYTQVSPYLGQVLCIPLSVLLTWLLMNRWVYKKIE
ncbi:GtrA family protein [Mariprofundus ferrooxydans]|uniref:GtrA family protein n=1 Tax=Mariprofundus ferrooxydans TaxID=314344 RepID=UPI00036CAE57|nr:GtrA family protein [Mariprofundus ferrooxydans]